MHNHIPPFKALTDKQKQYLMTNIKRIKEENFDEELSFKIAERIIARGREDREHYIKVANELKPTVMEAVNFEVLKIIFSNKPLDGHQLTIPPHLHNIYKKEDVVQKELRKLINLAYIGTNVHQRYLRQKVTGCMITILNELNGDRFKHSIDSLLE